MGQYAIVFDAGTGAGRCNLFDVTGKLVSYAYQEWGYFNDKAAGNPEAMLFDANYFKEILFSLCYKLIKETGISPNDIVAVSTTSQREGMVWLDRNGKEIYAAPSVDLRGESVTEKLINKETLIKEITGLPISGMFGPTRLLWYKYFQERVYEQIDTILMISDWICYSLCGNRVSEPSAASSSQLFDIRKKRWSKELAEYLGIRTDIFPEITAFGNQVGTVSKKVAVKTGLKEGTPVICGVADSQAGLIGMNVLKAGMVAAIAGTTTPVMKVLNQCETNENVFTNCHGVSDLWLNEGNAGITGLALRWVRDTFRTDYDTMTEEAFKVAPGCDNMRCFAGHEIAGRRSATAYSGFIFPTPWILNKYTPGHFYRSVYEANCYAVRANLEAVNVEKDIPLYVCGGQSASPLYNSILADVCERQIVTQREKEITGLGVAMGAFAGVGIFKDIREAAQNMSAIGKVYEPKQSYLEHYQDWLKRY